MQIPNSQGDKFFHWDFQNDTLIIHYEKKKTEATLKVSYFEKVMSHWEWTLSFIPKWVEYVSLIVF